MREWFEKHGHYWTFGLFVLAFLGTAGGLGVWGLNAQDSRQNAKVEKVSAVAESGIRRVEEKAESEVRRLDNRVENNLELIRQINARLDRVDDRFDRVDDRFDRMDDKLDRMDGKLDMLLRRLPAATTN
ncbi:MAG: hypothetical protein OXC28_07965 [Defluviicoccus sp.]|nr:hypothetical protein [Defluviicoccus sp.]